ncbi:glycosyltransferase family 9 protein [Granulicella arctica]|uniref:glycosyltransferase family 9 protein n=1 Tax=Granulicella arctica TaxID=940613 RepID=UPI0021DF6DCD|nr:glycosyltransferase family 9 protein [Granulicella arctica]
MSLARAVKGAVFGSVAGLERTLRPGSRSTDLSTVQNFLLLQYPLALGTAVHATPLIPALREAVPGCRIAVAASGLALEVFRNNPGVDYLLATPSPLKDFRGAIRSLRAQIPFGGESFAALMTRGNERTLVSTAAFLSGAAIRIGFTEVPQLYQTALTFDPERSLIDNNLRIVEALGHPFRHCEPQMFPGAADEAWADQTLRSSGVREGQMVAVFVTQTSVTQRKSWRAERFQATANFLIAEYGAHILFVGTAAEAQAIETLRLGVANPAATTSVAGGTTLLQLAALLGRCRVGLTLDTGPLHIGRTVKLPMVIVAPAWSPVIEWLPVGDARYRILKNADMPDCPPDYIIDEVSVDEVKAELSSLIKAYPQT